MARIWLNHWFSTAYNIIRLIREGDPDFQILGSNENELSPIRAVCDEWYREPVLKGKAYVDFCLDFCREHGVDVFLPRRELLAVSEHRERFEALGVRVMVDRWPLVSLLNRKDRAYEAFAQAGLAHLPEYRMAASAREFRDAYEELAGRYRRVCFKFVRDEGGKSYRLIDNARKGYDSLFKKQTTRMSLEAALDALSERETFSPVMLMPYLPGDEVSVDCLRTPSGLILLPRVKDATRIERVRYDEEILSSCRALLDRFPLEMPCNIQYKYLDGAPYLLEVNTRMSGGVQLSCAASGVNLPSIAVNQLLGVERPWMDARREVSVTHVEVPVVLRES